MDPSVKILVRVALWSLILIGVFVALWPLAITGGIGLFAFEGLQPASAKVRDRQQRLADRSSPLIRRVTRDD